MSEESEITPTQDIERLRRRVTELEQANERLEQGARGVEERYQDVLDWSDTGVWVWNVVSKEAYMSPGWFRLLGDEPGEIPNSAATWSGMIFPEDMPHTSAAFIAHMEGRVPVYEIQHRMLHKSGKTLWVRTRGKIYERDAEGRPVRVVGLATDVTAQKEAEDELRRSEAMRERVIAAQRDALRELSTPLLPIGRDVVVMPLIGTIDSQRAQQLMETLLRGVVEHRAATVIMDVTGVSVVDTHVAGALVRASKAVRLLGADVVLTGIRPEVAQTLVSMGSELGDIVIHGTLRSGIAYALERASDDDEYDEYGP